MSQKKIRAGWLLDGTGKKIQKNVLLCLENGLITGIEQDLSEPPARDCIDLSHCTLLPPLVDSHLHLFMSGTTNSRERKEQLKASFTELIPVIEKHLRYLLSHGVLAFRDAGDRGDFAGRYRREIGLAPQLRLVGSGRAYHRPGRYGSLIGRGSGVADPIRQGEEDQEEKGFVKVVNSGLNSLVEYAKETEPQYSLEELRAIVKQAEGRGQKVMVHANGRKGVRLAVEAGCHSIEHGFFMGRDNLKRMADLGTYWVPTVYTMKAYKDFLPEDGAASDPKVLEKLVDHQLNQLRVARELGVNLALGTDAGSLGVLHGEAMVEEMKLWKKAGFSLVEIIEAATAKGADLMGLDGFARLTPGNEASFLVSRGAPSQLPRKLLYLEEIYYQGESGFYQKNPQKHVLRK